MALELLNGGSTGITGSGTPGAIPVWVTTTQIGNSIMTQTGAGDIVVGTDPAPAATETLRVSGGFVTDTGVGHDNVLIGRAAQATLTANTRNVVIGTLASVPAAGGAGASENVVIGYNSSLEIGVGSSVIIGAGNDQGAGFPSQTTIVGANNTFNNAFAGPGLGTGSSWQGSGVGLGNQQTVSAVNNWVAVGRSVDIQANGATCVGDNVTATHANGITLGRNAISLVDSGFLAGAQNLPISTVHFGEGDTVAAPGNVTYRHTNASGTDAQGGDVIWRASRGTGNAATQGRIIFETGTPGASGAALQALAARLSINPGGVNGAAVDFRNVTTGAGGGAGTLANAPTAGDPAFWLPILIGGVVHYLPAWT